MMNTQMKLHLDEEKFKDFVGDFSKFFEDLAKWYKKDAKKIKNRREYFWGNTLRYSMILLRMKLKWKPQWRLKVGPVDREEKLQKVEEKLLSNKTNERFTHYDGVMSDDNLSLSQKIIHLQKAIDDVTRRKIYYTSLQGQLLENCFLQLKKVYKETWWK